MSTLRDDIRRVIIRPVISEKSFQLVQAHNQYTFRVLDQAHKTEVRQAVEEMFDVTVTDVRTVTVQSKPKRRGYTRGRRPGWKKAIVELKPGDKIELFEGAVLHPMTRRGDLLAANTSHPGVLGRPCGEHHTGSLRPSAARFSRQLIHERHRMEH